MSSIPDPLAEPDRVLVVGSCVAHDVAKKIYGDAAVYKYLWRISTPSIVSRAPTMELEVPAEIDDKERLTLENDYYKKFDLKHALGWATIIFVDLVRDSYDFLALDDGATITLGVEIGKYKLEEKLPVARTYHFGTLDHYNRWRESFVEFADLLNQTNAKVIFINSRWMSLYVDNWEISLIPDWDQYGIARRNFVISNYQKVALGMLARGTTVLTIPEWINYADPKHPWGANPMHLHRSTIAWLARAASGQLTDGADRDIAAAGADEILAEKLTGKAYPAPEH